MDITYRPGTPADAAGSFEVLAHSLADANRRGSGPEDPGSNPVFWHGWWGNLPVFDFLARTAEQWWVADRDGEVVGYARAILHDGVRELTEFFVLPADQSAGVGRELLARAFPAEGARRRTVLASMEVPAQARYLKSGVFPRVQVRSFSRAPDPAAPPPATDLRFEPVAPIAETVAAFGAIDRAVLEFRRDSIHEFLLNDRQGDAYRQGYAYRRGEEIVGYGYVGRGPRVGPFALLDASDFPAVIAHAEREAACRGIASFSLHVPMVNRVAVTYLLGRNYRFDFGAMTFMTDQPFGRFEQYLFCRPPLFM